ncbi:MAG: DUF2326 domain-containing protein [Vallitaleaceae bacterium]|nr:DUF2326 domain-containing protein [Vallitaleaceae bacterium]
MIYSIKSNKPSFKTVRLHPGFNVILAERTKESTKKDSRNGLGKSTLIEIIHFCLGANKGETLKKKELDDWEFTIELDIAGKRYAITRNTSELNKIIIDGDCIGWSTIPDTDKKTGTRVLSKNDWNKLLGHLMFGLNIDDSRVKYTPTFRSVISYFIRRNGQKGAFLDPFLQDKKQLEWDKQVNNSYLLGLDWKVASKWQELKDKNKILDQIKQAEQIGIFKNLIGTPGELEALKVRLESQAKEEEKSLVTFKVHPQYSNIEVESNELTRKIHNIVNTIISNKKLLEHYESALQDEVDASPESVKKIYEEAGLYLPELVSKRINDVLSFHKQVVTNRKSFLVAEIDQLNKKIADMERGKEELTSSRAELMSILKDHGALSEYTRLQSHHQGTIAKIKDIKNKIANLRNYEQGKSSVRIELELLQQQANSDLTERKIQKDKAILLFNSNSNALYEAPGTLSIDTSKTGYKFGVVIERSGSHGISNMKIFCYDLMLAQIWASKHPSPGFLIHDSILFADVDERQKALALELAAKESERLNFQYICTMNSDGIPRRDFSDSFIFDEYVRLKLSDATDDGGLLGIRF